MDALQEDDVPYGDDWDDGAVVGEWARTADEKRPWRSRISSHIAEIVLNGPRAQRAGTLHWREIPRLD